MFMTKIYTAFSFGFLYFVYTYFFGIETRNRLLVIFIDGLRSDFLDNQNPDDFPGFQRLLQNGARAEYLAPVYPSVAYPVWTSVATGLWPESHGIVGNHLYDPADEDEFDWQNYESVKNEKWWTAEPVWITATKYQLKTGVLRWGECDVVFDGVVPEFCLPITDRRRIKESFGSNIQFTSTMFDLGYDFIQVYDGELFEKETIYGPNSNAALNKLMEIDQDISYLLDSLEAMGISDEVNVIVVGGRGVASADQSKIRRVELDEFLDDDKVENVVGFGAFANIKVKEGYVDEVFESLGKMPGVSVYRHDDIPENLHVGGSKYTHDIWIDADFDTYIVPSGDADKMSSQKDYFGVPMGVVGYDAEKVPGMRAAFLAYGPDFRSGVSFPPINSVDVYPLLAYLLQFEALPNNGSLDLISMSLYNFNPENNNLNETQGDLYELNIYAYDVVIEESSIIYSDLPLNSTTVQNSSTEQEFDINKVSTATAEPLSEVSIQTEQPTSESNESTTENGLKVTTEIPITEAGMTMANADTNVTSEKPSDEDNKTPVTDHDSKSTTEKPPKENNETSEADLDSNPVDDTTKNDPSTENTPSTVNELPEESHTTLSSVSLTPDHSGSSVEGALELAGKPDESDAAEASPRLSAETTLMFQTALFLILANI